MKRATRLVLKKETLTELGTDELRAVAGAAGGTHITCATGITYCVCNEILEPIPTLHTAGAAC